MTQTFRRRILYIPGYDPIPPRRYRELFRREGDEQARISGYQLSQAKRSDNTGFGWAAAGQIDDKPAHAEFEVLVWSDIVQDSMGRGILATYGQLVRTAWAYIGSGALFRLMRLRRAPVIAALYPIVVLTLQLIAALLVAGLAGWAVAAISGWWWLGLAVALAGTWGGLVMWRRLDGRLFAYYLMHDYAFTARQGGAYPPALQRRIQDFADRIGTCLQGDWDEVLVVGHSSGAYLAVSALTRLFEGGTPPAPPDQRPALSLLTLGQVVPMASFLPKSQQLHHDLAAISVRDDLYWADVTAPGDACCFALCDPVAVTGVAPPDQKHPLILSAAFTQTLSPEKQAQLRHRWFRLHFQYLCAFDQPGIYDYFAITAGPETLASRLAGRGHSPGRIARAVNKGLI